jgi:hypothetical protein
MGGCTVYGIKEGDVKKMVAPYDKDMKICGVDKEVKNFPSLYFPVLTVTSGENIANTLFKKAICVKKCPKTKGDKIECSAGSSCGTAISNTINIMNYCVPQKLTG